MNATRTGTPPRNARRVPKEASPERLEKVAYSYLERYATSTENLRRVLIRRVERSAHTHGTDRLAGRRWVDEIISRLNDAKLLDDSLYAVMHAKTLLRRGYGPNRIRATLAAKGVSMTLADRAIETLEEIARDPELTAAITFARRRRLGPFRIRTGGDHRQRDLAALARAGISYGTARRVIDAVDATALNDLIEGCD